MRSLRLFSSASALVLLAACFDSGTRWTTPPDTTQTPECTTGERCFGAVLQECADTKWQTKKDCGDEGLVCAPSLLKCTTCVPDQPFCQGLEVMSCHHDGEGADAVQACDDTKGEACRDGACQNLCQLATKERSNEGCEYWGVDLDNADIDATSNAAAQQYAIVVSNAQPDVAANVQIFQDDSSPGDAPAPYVIAEATIAPLNLQVFKLGPREVDGSPDGTFNSGTGTALTRHAFKVVSDFPVVAFQFNPLDNVNVFSNDASLLKPREALEYGSTLTPQYVVAGWPQTIAITDDPNTNFDPSDPIALRAFLTIVGTSPTTHVRVTTTAAVIPGGPVQATPIGGTIDATVSAFDVLNLETNDFNADFTGSIVEADGPVAVFSGSEASDAPHFTTLADRRCCADHLEQQLDPLRTEGKTFAIAHSPSRTKALVLAGAEIGVVPEPDFVRFVAASTSGATVHTSLPPPDDQFVLSTRGDFHEATAYGDFTVTSSDPIAVAQVMGSQEACGVKRGLPGGDPSLLIEPPLEQFRNTYVFLTPDKYAFDFVYVVAPTRANMTIDDTTPSDFGCETVPADGLTNDERGGKGPDFLLYRCQLSFPIIDPSKTAPNNLLPGRQNDGVHRIQSDEPVGAVVYGFDSFVSYAYAAGTQLTDLSELK